MKGEGITGRGCKLQLKGVRRLENTIWEDERE
jgi:hypothetical protein